MINPTTGLEPTAVGKVDQSWPRGRFPKGRDAKALNCIIENLILELTDIVESPGQRRDHALQTFNGIASRMQDLGDNAPHPLMMELMLWKADIFFRTPSKSYARPQAKIALLRAIRDLK